MSQLVDSTLRVRVAPANPGQFFACCGLLELADRLWNGAEGWFEEDGCGFRVRLLEQRSPVDAAELPTALSTCALRNAMTDPQRRRREELSATPKKERKRDPAIEAEKKTLDALWREAPVWLGPPFDLRLDWFLDDRANGSTFKTWAGQQSVIDIATGLQAAVGRVDWPAVAIEDWLIAGDGSACGAFNFDSNLGAIGTDRDVGFSFDPLGIGVRSNSLIELAAFVGLQRFRPLSTPRENRHAFSLWSDPLPPSVASAAASGALGSAPGQRFEFRLLYRTKYLKSFLPAHSAAR
jgi:CRISPR-associated protein Csb3